LPGQRIVLRPDGADLSGSAGTNAQRRTAIYATKITGFFAAVDVTTEKVRWERQLTDPSVGGAVTTAGGLVFSPDDDGRFYAFDATTGKTLWSAFVGLGSGAAPITYEVNGTQYVAIALGSTYSTTTPLGGTLAVFKLHSAPIKPFPAVTTGTGSLAVPSLKWDYMTISSTATIPSLAVNK
jgi:glucose dehydrogenase